MRPIPDDLARAVDEWHATYRRLAAQPRTVLRRRLVQLSGEVLFHPYWHGRRTPAAYALYSARHWASEVPPASCEEEGVVMGRHSASRSTTSCQARCACRGW